MSIFRITILACGLLLAQAAGGCNNPLFDKSQWPSEYAYPPYLATPASFPQDSFPQCAKLNPSSSCCDTNTTGSILGDYMTFMGKFWQGTDIEGVIQDTFNDFNPVVQQMMVNYGWTGSSGYSTGSTGSSGDSTTGKPVSVPPSNSTSAPGSAGTVTSPSSTPSSPSYAPGSTGTATSPPSIPSSSSSGTTTFPIQPPDSAQIQAAFSPSPTPGIPDSYASIQITQGTYVSMDNWSYGRGPQRLRPVSKLTNDTQTFLRHKANDMNGYMTQLNYYKYQCQAAYKQHMVGMLCMGCEPDWTSWVQSGSGSITVLVGDDSCNQLYGACAKFLSLYKDLPTLLSVMTKAVKSTVQADPNYATLSSGLYLSDFDAIVTSKSADVCTGQDQCKALLCTQVAKGTSGIFPNSALIADPANLFSSGRRLTSSVTFQLDSNGYDVIGAGSGEVNFIIPMAYASTTGTTTETTTTMKGAPFSDSVSWANEVTLAVALLSLLSTF